ncbi:hypothetical protein N7492_007011 [Penicillium capsulatum]|uniref:Synaptobrevin n=1 Tax=Penicillium capsulatum TaxID=69766 RepID=A0A9W9I0G4_9EURO|nr:hypothetical protein N7492_007011 [Penicillium capsulatum]KAJ6116844.1 hypothetical protein N7512_006569 [Penicillium capsulatum]
MTVTAFPSGDGPDLTLLNVARLFTRLEHNLLSPGSERRTLRRSEFQRLRVTKNVEYARTLLAQLERSLPQLKPLDRRHEAQTEIARDRQLLKRMQTVLDEEDVRTDKDGGEDEDSDDEWAELFAKPVAENEAPSMETNRESRGQKDQSPRFHEEKSAATATTTTTTAVPAPTRMSASAPTPTPTLRNRHAAVDAPASSSARTTGRAGGAGDEKLHDTEHALANQRLEQEDLTGSLLSLASQLKASSQNFQTSLASEQSVLDRAVHGIDRTSSTMEAAGQRMGMLRRMTEGKGWWGRMMLYAWIFGLWVVAILIVFVGPKLRF